MTHLQLFYYAEEKKKKRADDADLLCSATPARKRRAVMVLLSMSWIGKHEGLPILMAPLSQKGSAGPATKSKEESSYGR